jgi:hypothetical protein
MQSARFIFNLKVWLTLHKNSDYVNGHQENASTLFIIMPYPDMDTMFIIHVYWNK